jgi:ribonuclease P protein component
VKRKNRITRTIDFKRVRQTGKTYAHPLAVILVAKGIEGQKRIGLIVGKAIGNAVTRNLIKRRLRSISDQLIPQLNKDVDIVVIAKVPILAATYQSIHQALSESLKRADLLTD